MGVKDAFAKLADIVYPEGDITDKDLCSTSVQGAYGDIECRGTTECLRDVPAWQYAVCASFLAGKCQKGQQDAPEKTS